MEIPKLVVGSKMYKLEVAYSCGGGLAFYAYLDVYSVVDVTEKGVWVISEFEASVYENRLAETSREAVLAEQRKKKTVFWVSTKSWYGKRRCYPTVELASASLLRRKERQLKILKAQLHVVEQIIAEKKRVRNLRLYDFNGGSSPFKYLDEVPETPNRPHHLLLENK